MNKGNEKISITAEFVSIIRSFEDPKNLYFVSQKGQKLYDFTKRIISEKSLKDIFEWRLNLSRIFDEKIVNYKPEQVIDVAAGYSLRGFNICQKNKSILYIDADFESVLIRKRHILNVLCDKECIDFPNNYHFVPLNVLENDIYGKLKKILSEDKKTLIIAEGLTSYFNLAEFKLFLKNIKELLNHFSSAEFYSHENINKPKGIIYFLLRKLFISFLTKSKGRAGFESTIELSRFLKSEKINNFKIFENNKFITYSIFSERI